MKTIFFLTIFSVFMFYCKNEIQAQNLSSNLDQVQLMQQFIGNWQGIVSNDTVEVWEIQGYGKGFINSVSLIIKDKKYPVRKDNFGFNSKEGKYLGFQLWYRGSTGTWLGVFTSEKKFCVDVVKNFNPETVSSKLEMVFETSDNFTLTGFKNGVKSSEIKFHKVK